MNWTRSSPTAMRCPPWTICLVSVYGLYEYELWHDDRKQRDASFLTFGLAKEEAERRSKIINEG